MHALSKNKKDYRIYKNLSFQKCVHTFLTVLKYCGKIKWINKGSPGFENPEIMEMLGLGLSNNKTDILLDQNWSK